MSKLEEYKYHHNKKIKEGYSENHYNEYNYYYENNGDERNKNWKNNNKDKNIEEPTISQIKKDGVLITTIVGKIPIVYNTWYEDEPLPFDCNPYLD